MDTLASVKKLEAAGFTRGQAEMSVEVLNETINSELATKKDLKELESNLTIKLGSILVGTVIILEFLGKWWR